MDPPKWTSTQGLKITENGRYCLYKMAMASPVADAKSVLKQHFHATNNTKKAF